jgi:diguanylate cyclase (GGDEF)-like protein
MRRRDPAGAFPAGREPRLVLRFTVVAAVGLALAGGLILVIVREVDQREAVHAATERARFVSETLLRETLRPADALEPVRGERRSELDRVMRRRILIDGALRVSVVGVGDRITYSTDHRRIGTLAVDPVTISQARGGSIVSRVGQVPDVGSDDTVKALVSSIPVRLSAKTVAVVSIEQDYAPIAASAHKSLLAVAGALELALVLLFVFLVPSLARASRRLRTYLEEIRYRATHDSLTGLSNREALHENLAEALRSRAPTDCVAVLLIDLDRFKEVNDTLGHDAGDELLRELARRLVAVAGAAPVSRLGGDEFAIVLSGATPTQTIELGDAVRRTVEAPTFIRGIPVSVEASVGVAIAPDDGDYMGQLVRRADVAMYAAKQGRAGVLRYDPETDLNDASKLVLMTELRAAVERGEIEVHYQPVVTAAGGTLRSAEALVRWRHPTKGLLRPDTFLPLAEHTRLVIDLTRTVLDQATRQCSIWRRHGSDIGVAVNLTVLDLLEPSIVSLVDDTLRDAGLPPSALTIEITESAFMKEPERVRSTLDALRALGIRIAIDDFGTGYSSLSYLRDLPVDVLKIDRSFIVDLVENDANTAIVAATIDLAHRLGLTVVAEGVDEDAQFDCLEELGCDLIQGYLISAPVSASALSRLMETASREDDQQPIAA